MITAILGAFAWVIGNVRMILIAGAVVIATNAVSGVYWYVKGYNSAALLCQVGGYKRQIEELQRDRDVNAETSEFLAEQLKELGEREANRAEEAAHDAANIKPIEGCVIEQRRSRVRNGGRTK